MTRFTKLSERELTYLMRRAERWGKILGISLGGFTKWDKKALLRIQEILDEREVDVC